MQNVMKMSLAILFAGALFAVPAQAQEVKAFSDEVKAELKANKDFDLVFDYAESTIMDLSHSDFAKDAARADVLSRFENRLRTDLTVGKRMFHEGDNETSPFVVVFHPITITYKGGVRGYALLKHKASGVYRKKMIEIEDGKWTLAKRMQLRATEQGDKNTRIMRTLLLENTDFLANEIMGLYGAQPLM